MEALRTHGRPDVAARAVDLTPNPCIAITFPGAYSIDNRTVGLKTRDFLEGYLAFRALAGYPSFASVRMMMGWLREMEGGAAIADKLQARLPSREPRTFAPTGPAVARTMDPGGMDTDRSGRRVEELKSRRVEESTVNPDVTKNSGGPAL
jgi:hypothetical protein